MKPESYKNINAASAISVNSVHPPFKVINGKITYVEVKTGTPLSRDFNVARLMQHLINSVRHKSKGHNDVNFWINALPATAFYRSTRIINDMAA